MSADRAPAPPAPVRVAVDLPRGSEGRFGAILQQGVAVRASAPTAWSFLTDELGVDPGYVKERITTIFLDGQVVDDLARAPLRDGSLLALSAAMPGLVGATLRRGGYYAAMRAAITRHAERTGDEDGEGRVVRVKLFNLLIAELGPVLLARGIVLPRDEAAALLASCRATPAPPGGDARGSDVARLPAGGAVELQVCFEEERS